VTGQLRFERLMVANRGEIAARVIGAAGGLGLSTVAVYSDADRDAPYLALADFAVRVGGPPAAESYLNVAALIDAACSTGATAVHPGYGFLSESSAFARACGDVGLVFVGPPASVIEEMSSKDRARRIARDAGLSVLPAAEDEDDDELVASVVARVGFPALVKAVAGGGGKAMHVVGDEEALRTALASARREAQAAFGDQRLFVERFVEHGRHVEVQVAGDETGRVVHLFERDCSVQRRHQKVIEEAPAPTIDGALRDRLCRDAVRLASSVGYINVGTVEFLVAGDAAFFLEMNTRLQVEHRVTEAVTGVDLVRLQLEIAQGFPIPFAQSDLSCKGHAIEARVYAEDPDGGFLPQAGMPSFVRFSDDALVDAAVSEGRAVTTNYDPMLAKLVVAGPTRHQARQRLVRALDESAVFGLRTNLGFLRRLAASTAFGEAGIDVNTLDRGFVPAPPEDVPTSGEDAFVALAVSADILVGNGHDSPLGANDGWRLGGPAAPVAVALSRDGTEHLVLVDRRGGVVNCEGRSLRIEVLEQESGRRRCSIDGIGAVFYFAFDQDTVTIGYHGSSYRFERWRRSTGTSGIAPGGDIVRAPMPGVVREIEVNCGSRVKAGEVLAVLESMKMEFPLRSPRDGVVAEVAVASGDHVGLDVAVVRLEALPAVALDPVADRDG
jgi:3-methylcrotonyl-CoA carboxylase alpha subunit/acetyl-CoA/propionyl-CoA carboxylase biotin carboxyl carrier protein